MQKTPIALLILAAVVTLTVGALWAQAQPPTPSPTRSPVDCVGDGLIAAKADLDALLADFDADAEADPDIALGSLYDVGELYRELALECGYLPANLDALVINSTDVQRVLTALETLSGDPLHGQALYNGTEQTAAGDMLGCAGCHEAGVVAPTTSGTWTRWDEVRSQESRFARYTFERYMVESILLPWDYFVATYPEYTMPDFYAEQLSYQDLADIIAYLNRQDQLDAAAP
ncbi:MAG: hypothetical protein H7Y11_02780 [Armatimonadetes bacterium]|nr:hypothetical protein [Anaerolineae bacterium]